MPSTELLDVLVEARDLLAWPDNDFAWSSWNNREAALREMARLIEQVRDGEIPRLRLDILFAPTGPIQEVSINRAVA